MSSILDGRPSAWYVGTRDRNKVQSSEVAVAGARISCVLLCVVCYSSVYRSGLT